MYVGDAFLHMCLVWKNNLNFINPITRYYYFYTLGYFDILWKCLDQLELQGTKSMYRFLFFLYFEIQLKYRMIETERERERERSMSYFFLNSFALTGEMNEEGSGYWLCVMQCLIPVLYLINFLNFYILFAQFKYI